MSGRSGPARWFFDAWSRVYDAPAVQRAIYRPVHDVVVDALPDERRMRILDLGCGTGILTERLSRERWHARLAGCDFSEGMLREARRRAPSVPFVQGNAQRLPFTGGAFDAVVSTEAFHWFPDQEAALAELARVLVPGGSLLLGLVNPPADVLTRLARGASQAVGQPARWPSRARMREQVEAAGFVVEDQRRVLRLPSVVLFPTVVTVARRAA